MRIAFMMGGKYSISDDGTVLSYINTQSNPRKEPKRITQTTTMTGGYPCVSLWNHKVRTQIAVHRLVAEAFVPGRTEERNEVNHKDGNVENCHFTNLEWVTSSENKKHAYDVLGRSRPTGSLSHTAVFVESDIPIIIAEVRGGKSQSQVARERGVHSSTISAICRRLTWVHVDVGGPK